MKNQGMLPLALSNILSKAGKTQQTASLSNLEVSKSK
jgi:hypothetical protein